MTRSQWSKMENKKENGKTKDEKTGLNEGGCGDRVCPVHGGLKVRGKVFRGKVIRKFPKRIAIEFERMVYVKKYERYQKKKTKIHARLPSCMDDQVNAGDYAEIMECRPLSKLVHFVYVKNVEGGK